MMAPDFLYVIKTMNSQTQDAQLAQSTRNTKKTIPGYITIKWLKTNNKKKVWKAARENSHISQSETKMTVDFMSEKSKPEDSGATSLKY